MYDRGRLCIIISTLNLILHRYSPFMWWSENVSIMHKLDEHDQLELGTLRLQPCACHFVTFNQ